MQIFMNGEASRDYAPDEVLLSATFEYKADTYDEALRGGVEKVSSYIAKIKEVGNLTNDDFKTRAYSVTEHKHVNEISLSINTLTKSRLRPKQISTRTSVKSSPMATSSGSTSNSQQTTTGIVSPKS